MKKLFYFSTTLFLLFFTNCKKEAITTTPGLQEEIATGKPSAPLPSILQWQKPYGSSLNELGFAIDKTPDGGYILAGSTTGSDGDVTSNHGVADAWIVKIKADGSIDWQKTFGGSKGDYPYDVISTSDGGYLFCGATYGSNDGDIAGFHGGSNDAWIVKLSSTGSIEWQKVLGGSGGESMEAVIQTSAGDYIVVGGTNSTDGDVSSTHGDNDAWIIKLNSSGDAVWSRTYGGSSSDGAASIIPLADGFMISAETQSNNGDLTGLTSHGGSDTWLIKINGDGDILWKKTYGGTNGEGSGRILKTSDGGYVFSTTTTSNNGDVSGNHGYADTWVVKINSAGNIVWQKCFGGNDMDNADIMNVTSSGQIVLVGYTFSKNGDITGLKGGEDFWTMLLDASGNKLKSNVLGGRGGDMGSESVTLSDDTYMAIGRTSSTDGDVIGLHGANDIWLVKFKFPTQ